MGSQTLEVKWSNHESNMISELQEMYLSDTLLDVTIACGEFSLKAHKSVLSASSTFFRKLFLNNPCKHPILIMTDIDFGDLKTIVEFIYQGKIHVSQQKLSQFLKTAEKLKIKGLSNFEDTNPTKRLEIDIDSHYSSSTLEHSTIQSRMENSIKMKSIIHPSPENLTDCMQNDIHEEIQTVKLEEECNHPDNNSSIYWQSDNLDHTSSSSLLPNCSLPEQSVSNQAPSPNVFSDNNAPKLSVSNQVSSNVFSDGSMQKPFVSHQVSPSNIFSDGSKHKPSVLSSNALSDNSKQMPSVSHQASSSNVLLDCTLSNPSVSYQLEMPLSSENFTDIEKQTNCKTLKQLQDVNTEETILPIICDYQTLDQAPVSTECNTNSSLNAVESLGTESSLQSSRMGCSIFENDVSETTTIPSSDERLHHQQQKKMVCVDLYKQQLCKKKVSKSFICKNEFVRRDLQHLNGHSLEKTFICNDSCRQLNRHAQAYTGKKYYKCDVCHGNFRDVSSFKSHMKIHTGENPYTCDVCHRNFRNVSNFKRHKMIHTGEKPYKCELCLKIFRHVSSMKRHKRIHTGVKPYKCEICCKYFSQADNLSRHKKTHDHY